MLSQSQITGNLHRQSGVEQLFARANTVFRGLLHLVVSKSADEDDFDAVRSVLEALPLASDDFATARLRIENASAYNDRGETGAAAYELALARRSLARIFAHENG